ncbi:3-hydroxyacyl-CoA dehydrogenase NAD-binding domain-containing protein [Desulfogranum japonicum]|uniref:3-hydroxyacyl-CoA dehydrogenase NAD-binding domain-containing protein n=1 Tax=Desulfogranum japonicum TaxID=231447 RepID=UPI00048DAE5A|nr:3-hydroxyacyl-CoA dehydrogenase NAD-binding domain-containing protein [Desulfogranum japonicum]
MTFNNILIIGAGTMGIQIAGQIARHGIHVEVYDTSKEQLRIARKAIEQYCGRNSVRYCDDTQALSKNPDLIIESVTENMKIKQAVLAWIEDYFDNERMVICSNTSDLLPSKLSRKMRLRHRFCAYHFHAPMNGANIVDIMPHKQTDHEIPLLLSDFTREIGLIPLVLRKEHSAYVYNNILNAIMDKSVELVIRGVADAEDIDRAWMGNTGMQIGPFGMLDAIGLDTALEVTKVRARKNPLRLPGIIFFQQYVKQGRLGVKSGQGFYTYPDPEYNKDDFLR